MSSRHAADPGELRPSGGFVWRAPLLPVEDLHAWGRGLSAPAAWHDTDLATLEDALAADRALLRERLAVAVERPEVAEALHLAAPALAAGVDRWRDDPDGKRGRSVERSLVRYLTRMATRSTPFGLLASTSTGVFSEHTRLALEVRSASRRRSQLDTELLAALVDHLGRDRARRDDLLLLPNGSLYPLSGQLRFVQVRRDGERRAYQLASLPDHPAARILLERAGTGARMKDLVGALTAEGHDQAAARRAVERLVDRQVLVADVALPVTGADPVRALIERLSAGAGTVDVARRLGDAVAGLEAIDAHGIGLHPDGYRPILELLRGLPGPPPPADPFHVVLTRPAPAASLGPAVLAAARRAVAVLHAQARPAEPAALEAFREAFVHRYDTREVPLVEALDGEAGVGYGGSGHPSPLVRGVPFPTPPGPQGWTQREDLLLSRVVDAVRDDQREIRLDDHDIAALRATRTRPPPHALAVVATLLADSGAAVDRGDFRLVVDGAVGPSGARLLGRFCHADPTISAIVREHLRAEEAADPETLHAEVVHLPPGREGNVVLRPVLRGSEIPCLGRSGAPAGAQLPITDLRVSVRDGRVELRSARLGRRVAPRLSSAHNASRRSLPLYRFLVDLQGQDTAGELAWTWGPLRTAPFLPRVVSGRLVLCPALWRIRPHELADVSLPLDAAGFVALQRWREHRRIPEVATVAQHDRRLAVDFGNVLAIESFLHMAHGQLARGRDLTIEESFLAPETLLAEGPEGRYTHELILPLVREAAARPPAWTTPSRPSAAATAHRFPPGSSWLYALLHTGPATADRTLREVVAPLRDLLRSRGLADTWFFLRYREDGWHLRVRFHGDPDRLMTEGLPALTAACAEGLRNGQISRLQLDTYERELEALGGTDAITHVEQLFSADSDAVLRILATLPRGDGGLDARWQLALLGMHRALLDLGLDLDTRAGLTAQLRDTRAGDDRLDPATGRELGRRFRAERASLERLLGEAAGEGLAEGAAALAQRSSDWADPIGRLRALQARGALHVAWEDLAERVLHLHVNRLLRDAHHRQELVLLDLLARLYHAEAVRPRTTGRTGS